MSPIEDEYALLVGDSKLAKILSEQRAKHPSAQRSEVNGEILQRVREIEQGVTAAPQMASLRAAQGEEIERLALIDPLTELYNTKTFFKELKDEIKRANRYHRPVSLCVLTVDAFGELCQQYGALTGDAIMKVVANVIRTTIRENDIPARYTAETLAIIFPEASAASVALLADKLRQRIGIQAISHNWHNLKVTASIGLASFPAHARDYDELIARAEEVLAMAISRGGDRVCMV